MFMWRSAPWFSSFTRLVSQPVRGTAPRSDLRACQPSGDRVIHLGAGRRIRSASVIPMTTEIGLRESVLAVAAELARGAGAQQAITLERPPRADLGDYSTNAALLLAPVVGEPPRELAQRLGEALGGRLGEHLQRFEVAGPGFLNLFLADGWHRAALVEMLGAGERFGGGGALHPERVIVEFVSANPTGPMHVGHARNAAYGDSLARVLGFHGHRVEREFYVNDAGSQVRKLGESIMALARGEEVPKDGYHGDYVIPLVGELERQLGWDEPGELDPDRLGEAAVRVMVGRMQSSLAVFRVLDFDHWAYESTLHRQREDLRGPDGEAGPRAAGEACSRTPSGRSPARERQPARTASAPPSP